MIYERIKDYIDLSGYKFSDIAAKADISVTTFNSMMNGKRKIKADEYFSICEALNVNPEFFRERGTQNV